jgi:pilus assembly protein CpaE
MQSVAVWSPKGGVGKSILAVALALKLAEQQRTVLIDGNADNPDLVSLLQCPGHPNVTGWAESPDPGQVESMLVRHSNRLWVLPGPQRYVEEASLSGPVMESILDTCVAAGMTVVVDLGSALRDSTIAALDRVDRIFVPVTLDLLSLAPLKRLHRELELLRLPASKFRVIINRHTNTREITADDVHEFSEFPIDGIIPSAKELAAAVNRGQAGVALSGTSLVGRAIAKLAEPLMANGLVEARKGGLFAGLRKGGA